MKLPEHDFYFITDSRLTRRGELEDVKAALAAGAKVIQYREKDADSRVMYGKAMQVKRLCDESNSGAILIINDRVDIALAVEADGIHIGRKDIPGGVVRELIPRDMILGISAATMEEARHAIDSGADYLGAGPIFQTATKEDADPATGTEFIMEVKGITDLPIVAIGGITVENAPEVVRAGADSVCAISATVATNDVEKAVRDFICVVSDAKN